MKLTNDQAKLAEDHFYLVERQTKYWSIRTTHTYEELHDVYMKTLIKTAQVFDKERGVKFTTLFHDVAKNQLGHFYRDRKAQKRAIHNNLLSLDTPLSHEEEDFTLIDVCGKRDDYPLINSQLIKSSGLTQVEQESIHLYYFLKFTQQEIADMIGCTQIQVSRGLKSGTKKLKKHLVEVI